MRALLTQAVNIVISRIKYIFYFSVFIVKNKFGNVALHTSGYIYLPIKRSLNLHEEKQLPETSSKCYLTYCCSKLYLINKPIYPKRENKLHKMFILKILLLLVSYHNDTNMSGPINK